MSHNLTERQIKILEQFVFGQEFQISDIGTFNADDETSLATLKRDLAALEQNGYIHLSGEKRGSKYELTERGLVHRPFSVNSYFDSQEQRTIFSKYHFGILDTLSRAELFTDAEMSVLDEATVSFIKKGSGSSDTIVKRELERFVIELSWKSSKIEGNTYTLLDTEKLIREGVESGTNTKEEAIMILNHKKAFSYIMDSLALGKNLQTFRELENIHRCLVEGLGIDHGLRKKAVGVTGTKYLPLDIGSQIEDETRKCIEVIAHKQDYFSKALLAILCISYLQAFEDGNKRTGRLFANAMLLAGKCAPLSYRDVNEKEYREAVLIFYEQNSIEPFKKIFIEQYLFSCRNYNLG